ncbi:MAG: hypothetical protein AABW54_01370, partial [Candidatus Micrarchaeota archaeon]
MRFFKHGDNGEVLAIVLPPQLQKSSRVNEGDEFEFIEVSDGAFLLVRRKTAEFIVADAMLGKLGAKLVSNATAETARKPVEDKAEFSRELEKNGFIIVEEPLAKSASAALEQQIKSKQVLGVRGFDKRYYIVDAAFYAETAGKILKNTQGEFTVAQAAAATRASETACLAVLQVLKEEGEVIEKK